MLLALTDKDYLILMLWFVGLLLLENDLKITFGILRILLLHAIPLALVTREQLTMVSISNMITNSDGLGKPLLHEEGTETTEEDQSIESNTPEIANKTWIIQMVEVFSDERGSIWQIIKVLSSFLFFGCILGLIMPKNSSLNTAWYPYVSSAIGYTYFLMWSVSFYPQVVLNYTRKSTIGLSQDFCLLNLIGCSCYMIYNCAFFYSESIQDQYRDKHNGNDNTVASNDVAFSINAFTMTFVTFSQILYYDYRRARPSLWVLLICTCFAFSVGFDFVFSSDWLQFFYLLSYIKLVITFIKYLPQAVLNYRRKSTKGWTIWNIVLGKFSLCLRYKVY